MSNPNDPVMSTYTCTADVPGTNCCTPNLPGCNVGKLGCCTTDTGTPQGVPIMSNGKNKCVLQTPKNTTCAQKGQTCAPPVIQGNVNDPDCCTLDKNGKATGLTCLGYTLNGSGSQPGKCGVPVPGKNCISEGKTCDNGYDPSHWCCTPPAVPNNLTCVIPQASSTGTCKQQVADTPTNSVPSLPPPPSPPCAPGGWKNGQCTAFLTDFGALSTDPGKFISQIFSILLSLSGGIALLLIIRAGYRITASNGKPEAIQQGREELTAAIVGLMFLIFSFVILQVIGVDILRIPGLGK